MTYRMVLYTLGILWSLFAFSSFSFVGADAAEAKKEIVADQRILASIRDHIITVGDVMKKMDIVFYQQYPQFRNSTEHRLQFYDSNWRAMLQELVERRVIMVFAEENHMEVGHGEVREELEELFGPNVLLTMYEARVSMDDAYDMIRQDIMMRRILHFYVRAAALASITPQKIKEVYQEKYENRAKEEKISWHILSLKAPEGPSVTQKIKAIVDALNHESSTFEKERERLPEGWDLLLSPLFTTEISQLSSTLRPVLEHSAAGIWSDPIQAKEAKKGCEKWSSYFVKERLKGERIPLNVVENEIQETLLSPLIQERRKIFIDDLIKKYDVTFTFSEKEMETYHPFHLG